MSNEAKKEEKDAAGATTKEATPEDAASASKKKRLIMFGAIGLLVVGGGGAGAFMFLKGGKASEASESKSEGHGEAKKEEHGEAKKEEHGEAKKEEHGEAKKEENGEAKKEEHGAAPKIEHAAAAKPGDGEIGETLTLKPFHLNLGNPLENHYIRLEVTVEFKGGSEQKDEITRRNPQLRDSVISIASRKSKEFLLGPDGKDQLRHEILVRLNQYMSKPVEAVYITDLLIE